MTKIRTVYRGEPQFPASDQHPDAKRYKVGAYVVDAVGGEPTPAEVEAVLNPPQPTPQDKLATTGLTVDDLKTLLAQQ